jgi:hypothetical protein
MLRSRNVLVTGLSALGTLLCGIAVPSAFWYLRAAFLTGNPLFPIEVKIGDYVLFQGVAADRINPAGWAIGRWVDSESGWLAYPWVEARAGGSLTTYSIDSGLGGAFATFVPLGVVYLAWLAWHRRSDTRLWFWLAVWSVCALIWWFPLHQTLRFGLVFIILSVVLTAPLFAFLTQSRNQLFGGVLFASICLTCTIIALEPASELAGRVIFDRWSRSAIYRYPEAIDALPDGATVLSYGQIQNIAMAGERLTHRVVGDFEVPQPLTIQFLLDREVDFVVGHGSVSPQVENLPGVHLFHSEGLRDPVGKGVAQWRIWKVDRAAP